MRRWTALGLATALVCAGYWRCVDAGGNASDINPQKGMISTYTSRSALVASGSGGMHGYNDLDQESWVQILEVTPENILYKLKVSAPGNAQANADADKFNVERKV